MSISKVLATLAICALIQAQYDCKCDSNAKGTNCNVCEFGMIGAEPPLCRVPNSLQTQLEVGNVTTADLVLAISLGYEFSQELSVEQLLCYNKGVYNHTSGTCTCINTDLKPSEFCGSCKIDDLHLGDDCDNPCESDDSCSNAGTCTVEQVKVQCGKERIDPSTGAGVFGYIFSTAATEWLNLRFTEDFVSDKLEKMQFIEFDRYVELQEGQDCVGGEVRALDFKKELALVCDGEVVSSTYFSECVTKTGVDESTGDETEIVLLKDKSKSEELCERKDKEGNLVELNQCQVYEECCNGQCYSPKTQQCVDEIQNVTEARYGWVWEDGTEVSEDNRKAVVEGPGMSPAGAMYIVILPLAMIVAVVVAYVAVLRSLGKGQTGIFITASISIFLSLFLLFSQFWQSGLLLVIGSLTAVGSQAGSSDHKNIVSTVVQFLLLVVVLGGMGFGTAVARGTSSLGTLLAGYGTDPTLCADFYDGYFTYQPATRPWDMDGSVTHFGYCGDEWLATLIFFSVVILSSYFMQMVLSATLTGDGK